MAQQDAAPESRPVIVAILASGAETGSLSHLLTHLSERERAAIVVVLQGREALDDETFTAGLRQAGCRPTVLANGMATEPGRIYFAPAGAIVTVGEGRFRLRPTEGAPGERGSIDSLLLSLADGGEARVVAIALSGTDSDGTMGFEAIKKAGGLALAKEMMEPGPGEPGQSRSPAALADRVDMCIRQLAGRAEQDLMKATASSVRPADTDEHGPVTGPEPDKHAGRLVTELPATTERLQARIEELTTVNGELGQRVQELERANSGLRNLLESTRIAAIFLDSELRITNYTPPATEIFDVSRLDAGRPIGQVKSLAAYDALQEDAGRVLRTLAPVEREIENPTTRVRYMVRVLPYRTADDVIAGVVLTFVDITARLQAEDALRDREQGFRAIVESARDYAILTTDQEGRINEWLPGATAVFGWSPQEVVGHPPDLIYTPEDRANGIWQAEFATASRDGVAPDQRWHLRKDGQRVFIEGSTRALRDQTGRLRGVIKIGQDVTERRRGLEALHESEGKAKLLLAELQHRVRNTLSVVRSIARRTARSARSVEDYASHLEGRLDAFARVQSAVTRNPSAGIDLEQLFAAELLAHAAHEGEQVVRIEGPRIRLQPRAAETLALAIHELATNAIKYGALSTPSGRVAVSWHIEDGGPDPRLEIGWVESGMSLSGEPPLTQGFGIELIERTLKYDLGGDAELRFEPTGVRCSISLPLTDRVVLSRERPPQD